MNKRIWSANQVFPDASEAHEFCHPLELYWFVSRHRTIRSLTCHVVTTGGSPDVPVVVGASITGRNYYWTTQDAPEAFQTVEQILIDYEGSAKLAEELLWLEETPAPLWRRVTVVTGPYDNHIHSYVFSRYAKRIG